MPVTARLSQRFYERLGDEINALVEWFDSVAATYRSDLRELKELNFERFDAKLGQRMAELRGELRGDLARLETRIEAVRSEMQRWVLASWLSTTLLLLGTLFAVLKTR